LAGDFALPTVLRLIVVGFFFGVCSLILPDRFRKSSAVVLGSILMVGTGVLSETDLVSAINWTALGVLLGMFIIASSLREAGFLSGLVFVSSVGGCSSGSDVFFAAIVGAGSGIETPGLVPSVSGRALYGYPDFDAS
jgi:Na+/H+ antiporter NhaD/arsenite permease-like protein